MDDTQESENIFASQQTTSGLPKEFVQILEKCGIQLDINDEIVILTQKHSLVLRDLEKKLSKNGEILRILGDGIQSISQDGSLFKKALLPTQIGPLNDSADFAIGNQQESLIRLFLQIEELQKNVIEILLNEATVICSSESDDNTTGYLRLLISQLNFLPYVKEPSWLAPLVDIIEIAPIPAQIQILEYLPDILPDSEVGKAANELCNLLDTNQTLSFAIIDCLNWLNLDAEIRGRVQDTILAKIATGTTCCETFAIFLEFLLGDYKHQNLHDIFAKLREGLDDVISAPNTNKEKESEKVVIFKKLEMLGISPSIKSDTWISLINRVKCAQDQKPIDLLILFMLHKSKRVKKSAIETVFRKRIRSGHFKCAHVERLFEKYLIQQLVRNYFPSICEIACNLIRTSTSAIVTEYASTLLKLLFSSALTESIYRQELIENLIIVSYFGLGKHVTSVLRIFLELCNDLEKLRPHTLVLMQLLELSNRFELKDVKLVFEILCKLTLSPAAANDDSSFDSVSGFQDELVMLVRKRLSSVRGDEKLYGIVSVVVLAKHMSFVPDNSTSTPASESSHSSQETRVKEAVKLLQMTKERIANSQEMCAMYYDQLAAMIVATTTDLLHESFTSWLYESITNDFQDNFVTADSGNELNGLNLTLQYNLNRESELETPISVNIAVLMTRKSTTNSIVTLAPLFRLLRQLHFCQNGGDLSSIDALLGCGVIMPDVPNLDDLDHEQLKFHADCLYHCANWFRETVSGFVVEKRKNIRIKLIERIEDLIKIERDLCRCLSFLPDYKIPKCYTETLGSKSAAVVAVGCNVENREDDQPPPKRRKKDTAGTASKSKKSSPKSNQFLEFRELDIDILKLLKYPLICGQNSQPTTPLSIKISHLNFILKDFARKLHLLTTNQNLGLSHLSTIQPADLIKDCVNIIPLIFNHYCIICTKLDEYLEGVDGVLDASELFQDDAEDVKQSFGLMLEIFASIFAWTGFQRTENLDLLRELLRSLQPAELSQSLKSANRLLIELVGQFSETSPSRCLALQHAVSLVKLLESLYTIMPTPETRKKIVKCSETLLKRRWYVKISSGVSIRNTPAHVDLLLKSYLNGADVKKIFTILSVVKDEISLLKTKPDCLPSMCSVDKANFYILYRNVCNSVHECVRTEVDALTNVAHLALWRNVSHILQDLMNIAKVLYTKSNMVCFMKKSISTLKVFLSHGVPMMEILLKSRPDQVVEIFKTLQTSTRFLHHLCCQSKLTKDIGMIAYVPQFRCTLETLVYRVKAALVANGCSNAFWMGNLRNKNIAGEDILSQITTTTEEELADESDDEELPPDDDDEDDDDIDDGLVESAGQKIDSESSATFD